MFESKEWISAEEKARNAGHDRIIGIITWLLLVLVVLYVNLLPIEAGNQRLLSLICLALFSYKIVTMRLQLNSQLKMSLDLVLLLCFVVTTCWFTGKTSSPFVSVIYMILMATSLTLGRRITYLMATLAVASYALLASAQAPVFGAHLASRIVELLPFVLIAHLGALLSGEAEAARAEVERLSLTDELTDLHNMRSFETLALQQEKLDKRYQTPFAICMLDADNLKKVNDRHGHLAGTELIKWTARIIKENIRASDIAARFGGDEFIIMYNGHDKDQIHHAVERIVRTMAATPFTFEGELIDFTISAGIASYPKDGADLRGIIMRADQAMYLSKQLGKNRVTVYRDDEAGEAGKATGKVRTILPRRPVFSREGCDHPTPRA
jgi:diguanylate cyclase